MFLAAALLAAATLTIDDYATMPRISGPRISPDGKRIAYVVSRADMERSVYDSDIWLADADGTSDIQLTRSKASDSSPRWSPDGASIAFLSDREGPTAIWIIGARGGEASRLTREGGPVRNFEWSPDGKAIAYVMTDTPSAEETRRAKEKDDAHVVGQGARPAHLYIVDVTTRKTRRMTRGKLSVNTIAWSPDGRTLAVERMPGTGFDDFYRSDLYTIDASTECDDNSCPAMAPLVVRAGRETEPHFSPDGKSVAYISTGGVFDWLHVNELWVVSLADRATHLASKEYDRMPESVVWGGDSRTIYFSGEMNTTSQLFAVDADGSKFRALSHVDGVVEGADLDARSTRAAFVLQTHVTPPEVYVSELPGFAPKQVTHHNDAYRNRQIGEMKLIRWKNPKDGLEIEGLLTLPVGYRAGTKVPLLTFVHGGPASRFEQSFAGYLGDRYAPQVLAAKGYAILMPNPRGSGGYGQKFLAANRNDWGGMDWIDINAGIDKLIADGIADPSRLGMMGWSYGGFMTAWAIGHSDRLRAISVGAPVVDLLSFHGTTDIRDFVPNYFPPPPPPAEPAATAEQRSQATGDSSTLQAMKHLPLSLDLLREHSPLWHLQPTKAHVLIQQGEADDRVPLSQGTMLYRMLDELGVDVTMITYPRQQHVIREPKLKISAMKANIDFFTKWIPAE